MPAVCLDAASLITDVARLIFSTLSVTSVGNIPPIPYFKISFDKYKTSSTVALLKSIPKQP